jgi:exodeoxyribonuclease VII large subunit
VQRRKNRLDLVARGLHSVSPLATLDRGYAMVTDGKTGQVVTDAGKLNTGDSISARLSIGSVDATITRVNGKNKQDV